jgi:hypothetical protein
LCQDFFDVLDMGVEVFAINDYVVDVDECYLPFELAQDLVHQALKDCRSGPQSKRHAFVLMKTAMSSKSGLWSVLGIDSIW